MTDNEKTLWAESLLMEKYRETGVLPKKTDFDEKTRARIKAFLGPWPRALEKAGIKEKTQPQTVKNKTKNEKEVIT